MQAQISAQPAHSEKPKPVTAAGVLAKILRRLADIGVGAQYFLRPGHSGAAQGHDQGADEAADAATPVAAADMEPQIKGIAPVAPSQREIERRRDVVRIFFNEFWSGASDKPAAFATRLDEAEDYLNRRLAANGESWRFDANAREMLGLPRRSSS